MSRDLMHSAEVKEIVRRAYGGIDRSTAAVAERFYGPDELARLPRSAIERALGVANHLRFAEIRAGDVILDIGCGGGIDTVLAAQRTGPSGRVVALDFLPEMLERTAAAAREAGLDNVETLESEMEAIELPDSCVDLIVSNGVINLSPRKARVMAECARVLRPGGRLCVSDLTVEQDELPKLEKAGFTDIGVVSREPLSVDDCALYPLFTEEVIRLMRELIPAERQSEVAISVVVRASLPRPSRRPASRGPSDPRRRRLGANPRREEVDGLADTELRNGAGLS
jgi:arsenite methyltransferase